MYFHKLNIKLICMDLTAYNSCSFELPQFTSGAQWNILFAILYIRFKYFNMFVLYTASSLNFVVKYSFRFCVCYL